MPDSIRSHLHHTQFIHSDGTVDAAKNVINYCSAAVAGHDLCSPLFVADYLWIQYRSCFAKSVTATPFVAASVIAIKTRHWRCCSALGNVPAHRTRSLGASERHLADYRL